SELSPLGSGIKLGNFLPTQVMPSGDHHCPEPTALPVAPQRSAREAAQLLKFVQAYWRHGFKGYCRYGVGVFSHAPLGVSTSRNEKLSAVMRFHSECDAFLPRNMGHARCNEISGGKKTRNKQIYGAPLLPE